MINEGGLPSIVDRAPPWKGTARYDVIRSIGEGGMGVVYEAFDRERRQLVAVKTLLNFDAAALYLFKQEFRTLADVQHPNLVHLYELIATETEQPFFTMELVRGSDFLAHVQRSAVQLVAQVDVETVKPDRRSGRRLQSLAPGTVRKSPSPADSERLRSALRQLTEGLHALHLADKMHRDIKPSNVLVTLEGRVVILDFGVATELRTVDAKPEQEIVGTIRYMAPEQAASEVPTPASDWYSVGVMLYEALVGRPPFVGSTFDVLTMKSELDPLPPRAIVEGVPEDLDTLCRELLSRSPDLRPDGIEILRRLGSTRQSVRPLPSPVPGLDASGPTRLVGRDAHLRALHDAFGEVRLGKSVTVCVSGASGMGKSALVQQYLDELIGDGEAVVLRGRTYERESVPFKAFDSVVDALSRHLMRQADEADPITLPPDLGALARVFPVLRRVSSVRELEEPSAYDPLMVRRRAFAALRELVAALGRRKPLVIYIDDIQWGDVDSAALLFDLIRPPLAPPLLLVLTYREEESRSSVFLTEMRAHWPDGAEMRDIRVGPLDVEDARRLALMLLRKDTEGARELSEAIARESCGSAFLVQELTRSSRSRPPGRTAETARLPTAAVTLEQMVDDRLASLTPESLRLLEIVAVGGRPLPVSIVGEASAIYERQDEVIALLRARRLVRTGFRDGRETVETSHDRFRETIVARLPAASVREHHERLARVLESTPGADAESLATHLLGAGQAERAAHYAERAAGESVAKLAFGEAVRLYQVALSTTSASPQETRRIRLALAQVLEWAGRGAEAAYEYLRCAEGASPIQRVDLERAVAEQLLSSGHIDEGVAALHRVLHSVGMRVPRSLPLAILTLLTLRLWLRIIGFRFREREKEEVPIKERMRIEAVHTVAIGLGFVDAGYAASMQARHMMLVLKSGDRIQVLRAAGMEAINYASQGGAESKRERELTEITRRLSEKTAEGSDSAVSNEWNAFFHGTRGIKHFLHGDWRKAHEVLDGAYASYPRNRAGWHANGELFGIWALIYLGKVSELLKRHARLLADAQERGNLYTSVSLRLSNLVWLAVDDVASARRRVREALADWSHSGFYLQHYRAMGAEANVELYVGDGASAYERVSRDWKKLEKTFLLRVQYVRGDAFYLRARCAIASLDSCVDQKGRIREAEAFRRKLERERMPWTDALASIVSAAVENAKDNGAAARRHLNAAIQRAEAADMALHAAAARFQLGALEGGATSHAGAGEAEAWMRAEGIRAPEKVAQMLVPGRWTRS